MSYYRTLGDIRIDIDDYWTQATPAEADTYFAARGIETWTGTEEVKTQALQRAWDYMKTLNWVEEVFSLTQPDDITNAQILLALQELVSSGVLSPTITKEDYLEKKSIANGAIAKTYRSGAPAYNRFIGVDMLLRPYVISISNIRMDRG